MPAFDQRRFGISRDIKRSFRLFVFWMWQMFRIFKCFFELRIHTRPKQYNGNLWLYVCFLPFLDGIREFCSQFQFLVIQEQSHCYFWNVVDCLMISSLNSQYDFTDRKQPFLVSGQLCNTIVSIVNRLALWCVAAWNRFNFSGVIVRDLMTFNSNNSSYDRFLCSFKYSLKECLPWVDLFQVCMWSLDHIFWGEESFYVFEK